MEYINKYYFYNDKLYQISVIIILFFYNNFNDKLNNFKNFDCKYDIYYDLFLDMAYYLHNIYDVEFIKKSVFELINYILYDFYNIYEYIFELYYIIYFQNFIYFDYNFKRFFDNPLIKYDNNKINEYIDTIKIFQIKLKK
jgi:hypothetical protein